MLRGGAADFERAVTSAPLPGMKEVGYLNRKLVSIVEYAKVGEEDWERLECLLKRPIYHLVNRGQDTGETVTLYTLIDHFQALPNFRMRWCTRMLKIQPTEAFMRRFPLREFGMDEKAVWAFLKERKISIPRRTDCALCYHQKIVEWKALYTRHPDLFQRGIAYEESTGYTFRTPGRDTWPTRLVELAEAFAAGREVRGEEAYWERVDNGESPCRVCSL